MSIVIDSSFAIRAAAVREGQDVEPHLFELAREGLIAPVIFWHEVASGLRNMLLGGRLETAARELILGRLRALKITTEQPSSDVARTIRVSDRYQLTIYDAAYLELAIRTGSGLATRDKGLLTAAPKASVPLRNG